MLVDTGNLTGRHLICDRAFFARLDEDATSDPVIVANEQVEVPQGVGDCEMLVHNERGHPVTKLSLRDCAYVPSLGVNVLCVGLSQTRGAKFDIDARTMTLASGVCIHYGDDYTFGVSPAPTVHSIITRGKNGPTHIPRQPPNHRRDVETKLWSSRFNDLHPEALRHLADTVDDVPAAMGKVDITDTSSDARLHADGRRMPTKKHDEPIATKPGEITAFDHWSSSVTSITGDNGVIAGIDNYSGHFRVYPTATKADAPKCMRRYYLEGKNDGVDFPEGSINYSDNEAIFTSQRTFAVCDELSLLKKFSVEYEPWGNAGIESVFRYWVEWTVRLLDRGGAPEEFWVFAGIHAEKLLNILRTRNDTSVRELWCGKRPSVKRLRVLFCKAVVRLPTSWRENKIVARSIDAVYLGEARDKPGSVFWSDKYGLVTSTNYTLDESQFPFRASKPKPQPSGGGGGGGTGGMSADYAAVDSESSAPGGTDDSEPPSPGGTSSDNNNDDDDNHDDDNTEPSPSPSFHPSDAGVDMSPSGEVAHPSDDSDSNSDLGITGHGNAPSSPANTEDILEQPSPPPAEPRYNTRSAGPVPNTVFDNDIHRGKGVYAFVNDTWCQQTVINMLMAGVLPSTSGHACAALPVEGEVVPNPHANIDDIEDELWRAAWKAADTKELSGILKWATKHKIKNLPKGTRVLGSTMQRKVKRSGECKSRLCVQGFMQQWLVDYDRKQSPCIAHASLRTLIAVAAAVGADIDFIDFVQAYTQSQLAPNEYVYVRLPPGWNVDEDGDDICMHITQSLYGMKQSGRNWFMKIRKWLVDNGYQESTADPCIFLKQTDKGCVILGLYVDDMVIVHTDHSEYESLLRALRKDKFDFTEQGALTDVLGLHIEQTDDHISITQAKYIENMVKTHMQGESSNRKDYRTPASRELPDLIAAACDSRVEPDAALLAKFRSLVGALLYCAVTVRPDISYAVGMLSRAMNKPTERLYDEAKRVLHYLDKTKNMGPRYMRNVPIRLYGMSDSDWSTRRSTSGLVFLLAGAVISYLSKKQPTTAMSSTEAEIMAGSLAALEAIYLRMLLADMGYDIEEAIELFMDNKGAIDLAHDYKANERTKHIERRHFKIRELVEKAMIKVKFIASENNLADIFTKPLEPKDFERLRDMILNMSRAD